MTVLFIRPSVKIVGPENGSKIASVGAERLPAYFSAEFSSSFTRYSEL